MNRVAAFVAIFALAALQGLDELRELPSEWRARTTMGCGILLVEALFIVAMAAIGLAAAVALGAVAVVVSIPSVVVLVARRLLPDYNRVVYGETDPET